MTTSTTQVPQPTTQEAAATARVPFSRLTLVELRKLVDTRAGKWLLIAIGVITAAVILIFLFAAHTQDLTYTHFVSATGTPQGLLLPVLGILAVTSEWSQRTGLITFTLEPNRSRVVWSKLTALVGLAVAAVVLALLIAALGNALGIGVRSGDGSWAFGAGGVRDVFVLQMLGILQGFAFGMLFMNSAASIVLFFVIPIAWNIVFSIVTWLHDHLASWIDLSTAQQPLQDHTMGGHDWAHLGVATLIWVVLPFVLGLVRVLRSEVKSA